VNITVDRDHLKAALARTKPAVGRNGLPVLTGVRIDPDAASLTTTNLDLAITTELDTDGTGDPIVVPYERLAAIVARCPAGNVLLTSDDDVLTIAAGRSTATLRLLPAGEWPTLPKPNGEPQKLGDDWAAWRSVMHARSVDVSRPTLCHLHLGAGRVFASDSYRAAWHPTTLDVGDLPVPAQLVAAAGNAEVTTLTVDDSRWIHLADETTTWSAVRGEYDRLHVDHMVPAERPQHITVGRQSLADAIGLVDALGGDSFEKDGRRVTTEHVRLTSSDDGLHVTGRAREVGEADAILDAEVVGEVDALFAISYLGATLAAASSDTVTLEGVDELKPWLLVDGDLTQLLMPIREARP
jgi:DNA polymerase III sliding clamp (beta) subunit (PCNA family)